MSMDAEKGLAAVSDALEIIKAHGMGRTVSGATVLLNAATTMGCFGEHEDALPFFRHVSRVYADNLDPGDYRYAGLYNNMAQSLVAVGDLEGAEGMFRDAIAIMEKLPGGQNEIAVTLCSMAEIFDGADPGDPRIADCLEQAWAALDDPALPRDGYYAFMMSSRAARCCTSASAMWKIGSPSGSPGTDRSASALTTPFRAITILIAAFVCG